MWIEAHVQIAGHSLSTGTLAPEDKGNQSRRSVNRFICDKLDNVPREMVYLIADEWSDWPLLRASNAQYHLNSFIETELSLRFDLLDDFGRLFFRFTFPDTLLQEYGFDFPLVATSYSSSTNFGTLRDRLSGVPGPIWSTDLVEPIRVSELNVDVLVLCFDRRNFGSVTHFWITNIPF